MDVATRNQSDVLRGEITHQHTSHGPVHHVHTAHVAAAYGHVVAFVMTGAVESGQVVRVVTEVGIHLEDVLVVALQCPLETLDVGSAQS